MTRDKHFVCNPVDNLFKMALKNSDLSYRQGCQIAFFWLEREVSIWSAARLDLFQQPSRDLMTPLRWNTPPMQNVKDLPPSTSPAPCQLDCPNPTWPTVCGPSQLQHPSLVSLQVESGQLNHLTTPSFGSQPISEGKS